MNALNIQSEHTSLLSFIETLSDEFIAFTGRGVYAFLDPVYVDGLFNNYLQSQMPVRAFARKCVKNTSL